MHLTLEFYPLIPTYILYNECSAFEGYRNLKSGVGIPSFVQDIIDGGLWVVIVF